MRIRMTPCLGCFAEATDSYTVTLCPKSRLTSPLEYIYETRAGVNFFFYRDLLSFFSFRAHLLGGGTRPPERLNSAVRHQRVTRSSACTTGSAAASPRRDGCAAVPRA